MSSMTKAAEEERSYIAFISYRHKPLDKQTAEMIQRSIERYIVPKELRGPDGGKRLGMVFRDEDELPASASLSGSITYALDHSEYLLVICTPDLPLSRWCEQEIRYFLETHDRDHVLAVLADGEPEISFSPYLLHTYDADGNITGDTEPLAANIAGSGHRINRRAYRKEIVRIYAALLKKPFDTLWQRERRARANRLTALLGAGLALMACFFGVVLSKNAEISRQNEQITEQNEQITQQNDRISEQNRQLKQQLSSSLVDNGFSLLEAYDRKGALRSGLEALLDGEDAALYDRRAEKLLDNALGAYLDGAWKSSLLYERSTDIIDMAADKTGSRLVLLDRIGNLSCISAETGETLWEAVSFGANLGDAYPAPKVCVSSACGAVLCHTVGGVFAFSLADGTPLWVRKPSSEYGNPFFALSPDERSFVLLDNLTKVTDRMQLVFCDVESGEVLGSAELNDKEYAVSPSFYDEANAYGAAFSEDGCLFGFCTYVVSVGNWYDGIFRYYLIDTADYSVRDIASWNDTSSRYSYIVLGMQVANGTGDMFCAQFHYTFGGLITSSMHWADKDFRQVFTNHTISSDAGVYFLTENLDFPAPLFAADGLALVFIQDTMFLFDPQTAELLKSFAFVGSIINAYLLDGSEPAVELLLSNGASAVFFLGTGDMIFTGFRKRSLDQSGLRLAIPIRGGLFQNGETGAYLTVRETKPGQLLAIRAVTDPSGRELTSRSDCGSLRDLQFTPAGDAAFAFYSELDKPWTVVVYDTETDAVLKEATFTDYFASDITVLDRDSFLCGTMIYYMDGTSAYMDRITDETAVDFYNSYFLRTQLFNGQVLTVYDNTVYSRMKLVPFWLDNELSWASYDKRNGLVFDTCDFLTVGQNGYILAYGKHAWEQEDFSVQTAEKAAFVAYDALNMQRTVIEDRHPEAKSRRAVLGTERPVFACLDDTGSLTVYDLESGEAGSPEAGYTFGEVLDFCFSSGDRYLLVLTVSGRVDFFDAANGELLYSDQLFSDVSTYDTLTCRSEPEENRIYLLIGSDIGGGDFLGIDTEAWTVVCNTDSVCAVLPANHSIYTWRDSRLVRYPIRRLDELAAWARQALS